MKRKNKKKSTQSNFSKLSIFQPQKYKIKRKCPLSGKGAPIIDYKNIIRISRLVLKKAIKAGGSSIKDFKNIKGNQGKFQKKFKVYSRENKKCLDVSCSGLIIKKNISNRSSFFCNLCQK